MHDKEEGIIAELETEDDIFGLLKKGVKVGRIGQTQMLLLLGTEGFVPSRTT